MKIVITLMLLGTKIIGVKKRFMSIKWKEISKKAIIFGSYLTQQYELLIFSNIYVSCICPLKRNRRNENCSYYTKSPGHQV